MELLSLYKKKRQREMDKFNIYRHDLDLNFMEIECRNNGKTWHMKKGEVFELAGEPARWIGYVESGYLRYVVQNAVEGKMYNTGFVFEGELVADYPNCLYGDLSEVTIVAGKDCTVKMMEGKHFSQMFEENMQLMRIGKMIGEHLFHQTYLRFLDFYRTDAKTRYMELLQRCPHIVQQLPLHEIASFLRVTPVTISKIRKELLSE